MTKAKTSSRRKIVRDGMWLLLGTDDLPLHRPFWHRVNVDDALKEYGDPSGLTIVPATLTWTPPAKAKRSAKR